jgi:prevent-host-death family protein
MPKTISSSELRAQIKRILNEVGYGQSQYVVERFGEPTAAIVSMEDLRLLQAVKQRRAKTSLRETIANLRRQGGEVDAEELHGLIEEARSEFYNLKNQTTNG